MFNLILKQKLLTENRLVYMMMDGYAIAKAKDQKKDATTADLTKNKVDVSTPKDSESKLAIKQALEKENQDYKTINTVETAKKALESAEKIAKADVTKDAAVFGIKDQDPRLIKALKDIGNVAKEILNKDEMASTFDECLLEIEKICGNVEMSDKSIFISKYQGRFEIPLGLKTLKKGNTEGTEIKADSLKSTIESLNKAITIQEMRDIFKTNREVLVPLIIDRSDIPEDGTKITINFGNLTKFLIQEGANCNQAEKFVQAIGLSDILDQEKLGKGEYSVTVTKDGGVPTTSKSVKQRSDGKYAFYDTNDNYIPVYDGYEVSIAKSDKTLPVDPASFEDRIKKKTKSNTANLPAVDTPSSDDSGEKKSISEESSKSPPPAIEEKDSTPEETTEMASENLKKNKQEIIDIIAESVNTTDSSITVDDAKKSLENLVTIGDKKGETGNEYYEGKIGNEACKFYLGKGEGNYVTLDSDTAKQYKKADAAELITKTKLVEAIKKDAEKVKGEEVKKVQAEFQKLLTKENELDAIKENDVTVGPNSKDKALFTITWHDKTYECKYTDGKLKYMKASKEQGSAELVKDLQAQIKIEKDLQAAKANQNQIIAWINNAEINAEIKWDNTEADSTKFTIYEQKFTYAPKNKTIKWTENGKDQTAKAELDGDGTINVFQDYVTELKNRPRMKDFMLVAAENTQKIDQYKDSFGTHNNYSDDKLITEIETAINELREKNPRNDIEKNTLNKLIEDYESLYKPFIARKNVYEALKVVGTKFGISFDLENLQKLNPNIFPARIDENWKPPAIIKLSEGDLKESELSISDYSNYEDKDSIISGMNRLIVQAYISKTKLGKTAQSQSETAKEMLSLEREGYIKLDKIKFVANDKAKIELGDKNLTSAIANKILANVPEEFLSKETLTLLKDISQNSEKNEAVSGKFGKIYADIEEDINKFEKDDERDVKKFYKNVDDKLNSLKKAITKNNTVEQKMEDDLRKKFEEKDYVKNYQMVEKVQNGWKTVSETLGIQSPSIEFDKNDYKEGELPGDFTFKVGGEEIVEIDKDKIRQHPDDMEAYIMESVVGALLGKDKNKFGDINANIKTLESCAIMKVNEDKKIQITLKEDVLSLDQNQIAVLKTIQNCKSSVILDQKSKKIINVLS